VKKSLFFISAALIFTLFFCCSQEKKEAIAFCFDDSSIEEWYNYRDLFKKYDIQATFFVSRPQLLDSNLIGKLGVLASEGHEIACHSYYHKNATEYQTPNQYMEQEILPALLQFRQFGFQVSSFAYPFGASNCSLDSALLFYFKTIRKATYNLLDTNIDQYPEIYACDTAYRVVNAMGIDYNFNITPENFETGIKRALNNNEVLIVYAHRIDTSNSNYSIHPDYLEKLFLVCKKKGAKSITMEKMYEKFNNY